MSAHGASDELVTVQPDAALDARLEPDDDRLGEFGLTVPLHTGDDEHLAAAHAERHIVDEDGAERIGDGQLLDHERLVAELRGILVQPVGSTARPTISDASSSLLAVGAASPTTWPSLDHRDAVGDLADLTELVGDEDDRGAGVLQLTHGVHQLVGLLRCEHGGGLVEHQHFCVA